MRSRPGRSRLCLGLAVLAFPVLPSAEGASAIHHRHAHADESTAGARRAFSRRSDAPNSLADDTLYRERGYGYGGTVFDLRSGGGPALGGTCTSVAGTPPSCRQGGIYGNGFIYGFGSP